MPGHSLIGDIGVRRGDAQRWDGAARGGCGGRGTVKDGGNAAVRAAQRVLRTDAIPASPSAGAALHAAAQLIANGKSRSALAVFSARQNIL